MSGSFTRRVSRDARELVPELTAPAAQGCCGALHAHNGAPERGNELANEMGQALPGTFVTTAGGWAAHLASVLGPDRVKELSQWLVEHERPPAATPVEPALRRPRIGLQDSCHLRNGLGVWREPRELIARVGDYVELASAAGCCGAAGSYAIVRPDDTARAQPASRRDRGRRPRHHRVVNPGCYRQRQQGVKRRRLRARVLHLAELLAAETSAVIPRKYASAGARRAPAGSDTGWRRG